MPSKTGPKWVPPRGAISGPLKDLIPVFVDVETYVDDKVTLGSMTLRQYLAKTYMTALSVAVGEEDPEVMDFPDGKLTEHAEKTLRALEMLALDPHYVFVAHNAAFDIRVLRFLCGIPQPCHVWCTMEGAMSAWPDLPGGYGLANCSKYLNLSRQKLELDLILLGKLRAAVERREDGLPWELVGEIIGGQIADVLKVVKEKPPAVVTEDLLDRVLLIYNKRDVEVMQELYYRQIAYIHELEQRVALMTHRVRRNALKIKGGNLEQLIRDLTKAAEVAEEKAEEYVVDDSDIRQIFNRELDGSLKSIRYTRLHKVIQNKMNAPEIESASLKKINPVQLAKHTNVAGLLEQTARASKMIFHRRRAEVFRNVDEVDVELGYARAVTFRFSSPSVGQGLNCIAEGTPVLTEIGWLPIERVPKEVKVWDGEDYVEHAGPVCQGERTCITLGTVTLTHDHRLLRKDGEWEEAWHAQSYGTSNLVSASEGEPCSVQHPKRPGTVSTIASTSGVIAETSPTPPESYSLTPLSANDAPYGVAKTLSGLSQTTDSVLHASSAGARSNNDASMTDSADSTDGAGAGSPSALNGQKTRPRSSATCRPSSTTGRSLRAQSTVSTTRAGTNLETSDWPPRRNSAGTGIAPLTTMAFRSPSSRLISDLPTRRCTNTTVTGTLKRVYDLVDCGPRRRFQAGEWIVHNCHNVPKHDKAIAKPVRKLFNLPDHLCVVRGDLSNIEYRVEGALTTCTNIINMFKNNIFADPYCESWFLMTGQKITKKMPIRQVSKGAVLGLGFRMSATGYAKVLLRAIASKDVTIEMLYEIAMQLKWMDPGQQVDRIIEKLGCQRIVALAAFHIHRAFNAAHPEFEITANWLVRAVMSVVSSHIEDDQWEHAKYALDRLRESTHAPDPNMIYLDVDPDRSFNHPSVRVKCGPWAQTLCWREPDMRRTMFDNVLSEPKLTIRKSNGTYKPFTPQLAIENVTQAAARNALCYGLLQLEKMGYQDILHVHDEIMLIVPRTREATLKAKDDLLAVYGPKADKPLKWAVLIKPDEVTLTQSLYEDENDVAVTVRKKRPDGTEYEEPGPDRWGKILRAEPGCLENLP